MVMLHTENQHPRLPESASKVWGGLVVVESEFIDRVGLAFA